MGVMVVVSLGPVECLQLDFVTIICIGSTYNWILMIHNSKLSEPDDTKKANKNNVLKLNTPIFCIVQMLKIQSF